jgi:hypothetical protein
VRNIRKTLPLSSDQGKNFRAAFQRGFRAAEKGSHKAAADREAQERWSAYCSDQAVCELLLGDVARTLPYAQRAAELQHSLWQTKQGDPGCRTRVIGAYVALGAFQLINGDAHAAAQTARRALEVTPASLKCKAVLTLGLLGDGQLSEAREILRDHCASQACPGRTFPDALRDYVHLRCQKGRLHADQERVEALIQEVMGAASSPPPAPNSGRSGGL